VCQRIIRAVLSHPPKKMVRNSEIMSGKPFELLRIKELHKHKVLLLPSPHQPRTS
jgi:hypothetical protein